MKILNFTIILYTLVWGVREFNNHGAKICNTQNPSENLLTFLTPNRPPSPPFPKAMDAGAQFIISPVMIPEVIVWCKENNIACLPGCQTPTEAYNAHKVRRKREESKEGGCCCSGGGNIHCRV